MNPHFGVLRKVAEVTALLAIAASQSSAQHVPIPGYKTAPTTEPFPSVATKPIAETPLKTEPYVFRLKHRSAHAISEADRAIIHSRWQQLAVHAERFRFNLSTPGWSYRQTLCPSFPGYILLDFQHGASPSGSSRFVAVLGRDGSQVWIVPVYAHGSRPFKDSWKKRGTYKIFNQMLETARGNASISGAPNWLMIGICYAELNGFPVQVITPRPVPGSMMGVIRLNAMQPQLHTLSDGGAEITFSDIAEPEVTANWTLEFNSQGQIISAEREALRQPPQIALRPTQLPGRELK